jgi:acetyl-CoA carboxylase biotin carboxylase subunit
MLKKCLIANRGEIAVRIIRACRELGIRTVAVYSDADADTLPVLLADEAYPIGGAAPADSYLKIDKLIALARSVGCDCVHPGYGFLSENADFALAVTDHGMTWVGPPPDAIRQMGSKTEARERMKKVGVPTVPGFEEPKPPKAPASDRVFVQAAESIGYPVMVKAAAGGGGKGIRIVRHVSELPEAIASVRREAQKAFGDSQVFLERYIEHARHIEVQVIADQHGHTLHLFERECSTQRRHQKIIEETPSPLLTEQQRQAIGQAAVQAAQAVDYVNAGTVEFIATKGEFFFLEMNTRLQVEHPVTELVTGIDIVKLQFRIASGEALPFQQSDLRQRGHAIECRVYAEDPQQGFLPATGTVQVFTPPTAPNVRVDTYLQSGSQITIHYDPMIAKIITYAEDRPGAIARMRQALQDTVVLGVTHNIPFLQSLLTHRAFQRGEVYTTFVDEYLTELVPPVQPPDDLALIAAALSDFAKLQQPIVGAASTSDDADSYSPWQRTDSFRLNRRR